MKGKSIGKARPNTPDTCERHAYDTRKIHAKYIGDTSHAHVRHVHDMQNTHREQTDNTLSRKEVESVREFLQEWKSLKVQLNDSEGAEGMEPVILQEKNERSWIQ